MQNFKKASKKMYNEVEQQLFKIGLIASNESYDLKNSCKALFKFKNLNKSYGSLKAFVNYLNGCKKFYECETCKNMLQQLIFKLNKFINFYEYLL